MSVRSDRDNLPDALPWNEREISHFRTSLLRFFGESARELPWRAAPGETPDPYRVLVSEMMLQQTRVETVVPYFHRWMARFPTPEALAESEIDEVLKVWEGLGYYSRARNLHGAVHEVIQRYDGQLPSDPDALQTLPGVGPYTAGAVSSIAFGVAAPAVDGNVRRVLSRLLNHPAPSPSALRRWAAALVDPECPGHFNQALMELGSLVCTPRAPDCGSCPVSGFCAARAAGTQHERPAPRAKGRIPQFTEAVAILEHTSRTGPVVLLRRRNETGLLAGMWELPGRTVASAADALEAAWDLALETLASLGSQPGPFVGEPQALSSLDHTFSHRKVRYVPFRFDVRHDAPVAESGKPPSRLRWAGTDDLENLAIPAAQRRLLSSRTADR